MKLLSGILLGALIASGVFFYFSKTNKERESTASASDSMKPVPMNMYEPKPENKKSEIKIIPSGTVTFLLAANNEIYYYKGVYNDTINKTDYIKLRSLIKKYKAEIKPDDLMFIIKSEKASSFKNAIDILDEMTINNIPPGHYMETEITEAEIDGINIKKQTKNG